MGYEIIDDTGSVRTVRFAADRSEVDRLFGRVRARINRELSIPGFRPGHVPRSIIDARFGNIVRSEVAEELRETLTAGMLDEQDWVLADRRSLGDALPVEGEDYEFSMSFTLFEIPPPTGYGGMELRLPRFDAGEAAEATIEGIRAKMTGWERTDRPSADGDLVMVEASRAEDTGSEPERMALRLGRADLGRGLDGLLQGRTAGDSATARIEFDDPAEAEPGKPTVFTVREVLEPRLPALDDEFARRAGRFDSLSEMRSSIRERVAARWETDRREELEAQVVDGLIAANPFDPPAYMVDNLAEDFERNLEGGRDEGTTRAIREIAARKVREFLLLRAVGIAEGLVPSEEDLAAEVRKGASRSSAVDRVRNRMAMELVLSGASIVEREASGTEGRQEDRWSWKTCEVPGAGREDVQCP
jgi:trigger factor